MRKPEVKLGKWKFYKVALSDQEIFYSYRTQTPWPVNIWSSNFPFIWAYSAPQRDVLWRIVDGLLVIFVLKEGKQLSLLSLPFGPGDIGHLIDVLTKALNFCRSWNSKKKKGAKVRTINSHQLEYLQGSPQFQELFLTKGLRGRERYYSVEDLALLKGKKFESLRRTINRFYRKYPDITIRKYRPTDYHRALTFNKLWEKEALGRYPIIFDRVYYEKILRNYQELQMFAVVAELNNTVIGINLAGVMPSGQGWGCICKTSHEIEGLNEAIIIQMIRDIHNFDKGVKLFNVGSDLGIQGLISFKEKFKPVLSLERYKLLLK